MRVPIESDLQELAKRLEPLAPEFEGKTVLLFGGLGFLGRYFIGWLSGLNRRPGVKPCRLLVYDSLITSGSKGADLPKSPHLRFTRHDIIQPIECGERPDYIIHLAGIASPYYYRAYPLETLGVATSGTRNLLEIARRHGSRLLFFSSSEIYGDPDPKHVPTLESYRGSVSCLGPRACYDESKRLGETLCWVYHEKYGVSATIVRPFNVYGPGMKENDYRVLPNFASRLKAGKPLSVYGSGRQTRTFCYATDAVEGFVRALLKGNPGEAYNIDNPRPEVSMLELARLVAKAAGGGVEHRVVEYPDSYPSDEPQRRCPDITKARLQLGFTPKVSLEEGLKRFLAWTDGVYTGEPAG